MISLPVETPAGCSFFFSSIDRLHLGSESVHGLHQKLVIPFHPSQTDHVFSGDFQAGRERTAAMTHMPMPFIPRLLTGASFLTRIIPPLLPARCCARDPSSPIGPGSRRGSASAGGARAGRRGAFAIRIPRG